MKRQIIFIVSLISLLKSFGQTKQTVDFVNSKDTIITYRNTPTTLIINTSLLDKKLNSRVVNFKIDSVEVINRTDTSISFIPGNKSDYLDVKVGFNNKCTLTKTYRILKISEPIIVCPDVIFELDPKFDIRLEPNDELKSLANNKVNFIITRGLIYLIRNYCIIDTWGIDSPNFGELKNRDVLLVIVQEYEIKMIGGEKYKKETNLIRYIKVE